MKISYNWLKWYVPEIPEADKLADVFTYHLCEVESVNPVIPDLIRDPRDSKMDSGSGAGMTQPQDWVFDLNILPNRAHDLLSFHGVAHELAGQLGIKFNDPTPYYKIPESKTTDLSIEIQDSRCRRYMGRIVRNIKIGPSPEWVVKHLESIGQRSINNIVDATNLCMFDCGQPMHIFDLGKIKNMQIPNTNDQLPTIQIRNANAGEKIQLLGGEEKELKTGDLVITCPNPVTPPQSSPRQGEEECILALAGVKGGTKAEVDDFTTDIVLEVANFDPATVRKTARRLGIFTDSAKRFENDLSPEQCSFGMKELTGLIMEMCPEAIFEDVVDVYPNPQTPRVITFSTDEVNKMLGTDISSDAIEAIFVRYGYTYDRNDESFKLCVPDLRLDLTGAHDMAEEIGRIIGYEKVVPTIPKIEFSPKNNEEYMRMSAAREKLLADGYSEVMTYTFTKKGKVEVARGAKGKEFLRTNLADALKESYELNRLNAPLIGVEEIKIFEIGTVFSEKSREEIHVAYADKKGVVESTLEEFVIPDLIRDPRDSKMDSGSGAGMTRAQKFVAWSQYPFITRDIAVWVPFSTHPNELISLCKENGTVLLAREPKLFDQFTKGDKTSLAIRMVFQSPERTLTDAEITEIMQKIAQEIAKKDWEVR